MCPESMSYPWHQFFVTCCTPNRPVSTCQEAKTPHIGPFYRWWPGVFSCIWRCCLACVTEWEVFRRWSTTSLSLYGSNLWLRVLLCYPYDYILSCTAKTVPEVVTRLLTVSDELRLTKNRQQFIMFFINWALRWLFHCLRTFVGSLSNIYGL